MSTEEFATLFVESLKKEIIKKFTELIPQLVKEITPSIIELTKKTVESILQNKDLFNIENVKESVSINNETQTFIPPKREYNLFKDKNQQFFDDMLQKRESEYYKYNRNEQLLDLYAEGMQEEPIYIPRKFRSDNCHVKSNAKLTCIRKVELQRFRSECEIIRIRRDNFTENVFEIDNRINEFVTKSNLSTETKDMLLSRWNTCVNEDIDRIKIKSQNKFRTTKTAFNKDKEFLKQHLLYRIQNYDKSSHKNIQQ